MIRVALILSLLSLNTTGCAGDVGPLPSARFIAGRLRSMHHRALQSTDVCSTLDSYAEPMFNALFGVAFNCDCSLSGSVYKLVCQSGSEICCGDICGSVKHTSTLDSSGSVPGHEQTCSKFNSPADIAGQERCAEFVYCGGVGSTSLCSCSGNVDGQSCGSCGICKQPTMSEPWAIYAVNCTNVAGFEDFPADCTEADRFISLACASSAPTSSSILSLAFVSTLLVAISFVSS